jgi:hypothetical protein|tara:strand:+ start:55 stop:333 length:279 start_codon:yes stop_codon:yes gene_type:complete
MIDSKKRETVEEYLKRGGRIERNPQLLNTVSTFWSTMAEDDVPTDSRYDVVKTVSWKSLEADPAFDTEEGEGVYFKELNKRMDKIIKRMKKA